jgi:hypothetical protein
MPAISAPVKGSVDDGVGVTAGATEVTVKATEAVLPAGSVAVMVWVPTEAFVGTVNVPVPTPLAPVVIVPSVVPVLWKTIVKVSTVNPCTVTVTVIDTPGGPEVGLIVTVTVATTHGP